MGEYYNIKMQIGSLKELIKQKENLVDELLKEIETYKEEISDCYAALNEMAQMDGFQNLENCEETMKGVMGYDNYCS